MRIQKSGKTGDFFDVNSAAIARENIYLLKKVNFCAFLNMAALSVISPFLSGFTSSWILYVVCAALTAAFSVYCRFGLDKYPRTALPLFYCLLAALCAYAVALSAFFYPDIHGVTIVGIFMLVPMVVFDRSWRINTVFFSYYIVSCIFAVARKPQAIAIDDCVTCGAFMVFGMLIGTYLRHVRLLAIEQQRQLKIQRDIDSLTGLPNRRVLFEMLADSVSDGTLDGVIMIDIDNFKGYNDRKGHQAGDNFLRQLGDFLAESAALNDYLVFRYGGEEFLALCRSMSADSIAELSQKIVDSVRAHNICGDNMTVSAGYASRGAAALADVDPERLINMADAALYEAKRLGRDRSAVFSPQNQPLFTRDKP